MFKKLFVGLGLLWCAGVFAQLPQRLPGIPLLGVALMEKSNDMPGVMVVQVGENTPAAVAGFSQGDFLIRMGHRAINTAADVLDALAAAPPGASIQVVVRRGDQEQTLDVTPGSPIGIRP